MITKKRRVKGLREFYFPTWCVDFIDFLTTQFWLNFVKDAYRKKNSRLLELLWALSYIVSWLSRLVNRCPFLTLKDNRDSDLRFARLASAVLSIPFGITMACEWNEVYKWRVNSMFVTSTKKKKEYFILRSRSMILFYNHKV